ncbi:hypothetical protein DCAR_0311808 [Daucus carota subsp. sativus]|uniref:Uncharacterized protein n=1 Tax=Daucus carota subsp. sativus TaxID=79200 RepID=A0AAF0WQ93_DAUCS|nr:hypothetical protein DCAR_0311808 [Daucus carota subsp. sativus]
MHKILSFVAILDKKSVKIRLHSSTTLPNWTLLRRSNRITRMAGKLTVPDDIQGWM